MKNQKHRIQETTYKATTVCLRAHVHQGIIKRNRDKQDRERQYHIQLFFATASLCTEVVRFQWTDNSRSNRQKSNRPGHSFEFILQDKHIQNYNYY